MNKSDINAMNISDLKKHIKTLKKELEISEKTLAEKESESELLKFSKKGVIPELAKWYSRKRTYGEDDDTYYSDCFNDEYEREFEYMFDTVNLDRYERYSMTDVLLQYCDYSDWNSLFEELKLDAKFTKEVFDSLVYNELKNFDGMSEQEIAAVRKLIEITNAIKIDNFKWDW